MPRNVERPVWRCSWGLASEGVPVREKHLSQVLRQAKSIVGDGIDPRVWQRVRNLVVARVAERTFSQVVLQVRAQVWAQQEAQA